MEVEPLTVTEATVSQVLTAEEVAALLRVPLRTAWRLGRERRIPGVVRVGRQMRFNRAALEQWVEQGGDGARADGRTPDTPKAA